MFERPRIATVMSNFSPLTYVGLALIAGYWVWLWAFFTHVRPRLMQALGRRLQVAVRESTGVLDGGTYSPQREDVPLSKQSTILGADLLLLLAGTVGIAALVFIPAFLIADSGRLLSIEGRLTGRRVTLEAIPVAMMPNSKARAAIDVAVRNDGTKSLAPCIAKVADYSARNGYLNGKSALFALEPRQRAVLRVELDAIKPPAGEHRYRIEVECGADRLAVGEARLLVR